MSDEVDKKESEHMKTEAFGKRLSGNLVIVAVVLVILFATQSIKTDSTSSTDLGYTDSTKFQLNHPLTNDKCLRVSDHGTIKHAVVSESKYNELTITHTTKLVCKPDFDWEAERSIIKNSK